MENSCQFSRLRGKFLQNFLATSNFFSFFKFFLRKILTKVIFSIFLYTTSPKESGTSCLYPLHKQSEKNNLCTKYWRKLIRGDVWSQFGNTSFHRQPFYFSIFWNFVFRIKNFFSLNAKLSYFYLMRNICCIWKLSGGTMENPKNE